MTPGMPSMGGTGIMAIGITAPVAAATAADCRCYRKGYERGRGVKGGCERDSDTGVGGHWTTAFCV